jgi:sugar lactone lactonase YvrE
MRRFGWTTMVLSLLAATLVAATPAASPNWPSRIDLLPGFLTEGIAIGNGHTFYVGSTATTGTYPGSIYAGDLRTGEGAILVPGATGRSALGIFADNHHRLWVAGGSTGHAYVYDARTGELLQDYTLAPTTPRFINDVFVTKDAAYFTNTSAPVIYRVPLGPGGELSSTFDTLTFPSLTGAGLNGIEGTPNGKTLIIAAFTTGRLYALDTETLAVHEIVLDELVPRGDGLVLSGKTLYVVQNLPSGAVPGVPGQVAVVELSNDLSSGDVVAHLNSADAPLVNPATADQFGDALYIVRRAAPAPAPASFYLTRIVTH